MQYSYSTVTVQLQYSYSRVQHSTAQHSTGAALICDSVTGHFAFGMENVASILVDDFGGVPGCVREREHHQWVQGENLVISKFLKKWRGNRENRFFVNQVYVKTPHFKEDTGCLRP